MKEKYKNVFVNLFIKTQLSNVDVPILESHILRNKYNKIIKKHFIKCSVEKEVVKGILYSR